MSAYKILLVTGALLVLFFKSTYSQTKNSIRGKVVDTATQQVISNVTVCVLNAKDSTLYQFTRTVADGTFNISKIEYGKYILLISYPGFVTYFQNFKIDSTKSSFNFGNVNIILKTKLLAEVLIKANRNGIKIKHDTTEFNADNFVVQPNAKVEDLLKQLPGIQIDNYGKITAQGQTINKVLVDGEEFFGDDPTLVTKNIRADMVDKVQLYDKKSDQATFTGVDDGKKIKTINIQLKEDKKNGYFGKIDGGVGTNDYYQSQGMFNSFNQKSKFSVYGTIANTGKTGLGYDDSNKYGSSPDNTDIIDNGGIVVVAGKGDDLETFDGRYNGEGIPISKNGGFHFDDKWDEDMASINANYKLGSLDIDGEKNTLTQNNLPTGIIYSSDAQKFNNYIFKQKADVTYSIKLDTTSTLKISVDGNRKNSKTQSNYSDTSTRENKSLLNQSSRSITNDVNVQTSHISAFYTKKFKKAGRTLSLFIEDTNYNSSAQGYLNSKINFYGSADILDSIQKINQYKTNNIKTSILNSNFSFSEPISLKFSAVFNYGLSFNKSSQDRESFDQSPSGIYNIFDDTYSNNYKFNQFANVIGLNFNYKNKKTLFIFGSKVAQVSFDQLNLFTDETYNRKFININPQASYEYSISQISNFKIDYSGNTVQPTIDQIQPVRINTDPLNITIGNPNLKPAFNNQINLTYTAIQPLSGQFLWLTGAYNIMMNPILLNTVTDSTGKSTYQSINLTNKKPYNFFLNANLGKNVKSLNINAGLNANANIGTSYSISNNVLNVLTFESYSLGISLSKNAEKKFDFNASIGPTYNVNESSLQKINSNGWGVSGNGSFNIFLTPKIQLGSDFDYQYRGATQSFHQNFERFILNTRLAKTFFKEDNLKFSLSGYDLLNQNRGFDRSASAGMLTQTTYTNIKRYFMIAISWDFTKMNNTSK